MEVIPWAGTQVPHECERNSFGLEALGSKVVAQQSVAALLQPHNLDRTGAHHVRWLTD